MTHVVGIDLGTTYCAVAVADRSGSPSIVRNREGENITPSVVMFQGDTVVVGSQAKRSAATAPDHVVQFVKRYMGETKPVYHSETGTPYRPEEISALLLKRLKEDAEIMLGEPVERAVITVPAYFDDLRRRATQDAGRLAGLEVLRIVNEPTAAALAYGLDQSFADGGQDGEGEEDGASIGTVLVYDLGGGTFDVTVMRVEDGDFTVIATDGDRNLGGFDWDGALMNHLNGAFMASGGPDLTEDSGLQAELRDKAEIAKRTLSNAPQAVVVLSAGGRHEQIRVTREKFEEITAELLDRTRIITEGVLAEAGLGWDGIDRLLLVGGSTRMPMVQELIQRLSGREPERGISQDEVVALGAALVALDAAVRAEEAAEKRKYVGSGASVESSSGDGLARLTKGKVKSIKDVTSQSLGMVVTDLDNHDRQYNAVIIPHNTPVPTKKSDTFYTLLDRQRRLRVQVTEGDDEDLAYVKRVGEGTIEIPQYPKRAPFEVIYSYDVDGIIHVEVKDGTTGKWLGEFELERPDNLSPDELAELGDRVARIPTL
ncbi:Hsp70 family protein [Streptomyces lancefieldiae]|uniref:Hsp70 family protein n=1 Tax=Streptomyces lancefieldiae TaxID=3075520 RepID=A0ABU3B2M6_9ACTN|nr:Hsp70 family protein [Streptomyces sp. DSM 40712]MDT0615241.1 Hsp70 family protein [Streptomyces sp. DSM 40712]